MPLPKEGCFQVTHPSTAWVEVPCIRPPEVPYISARGRAPETVGNGTDNSSEVSGTISWAEGSFPSVSGVTSETDGTSNNYSLQLNSNNFTQTSAPAGPSCSGALTPSSCQGWQQFIYSSGGSGASTSCTGGAPCVFMQYWLLDYGKTCPTGWNTFGSGASTSCWQNSTNGVAVPAETITALANLALTGTAGNKDSVAMTVAGTVYAVSQATVLGLSADWTTAEFNVVGN